MNSCVISLDTESRTNDIRKVINKNEEQSKFEDSALRDTHIYISIFLGSIGRSLDRAARKKNKKKNWPSEGPAFEHGIIVSGLEDCHS